MYKRYYDGYGSFQRQRPVSGGEVIIPEDCICEKENNCEDHCHNNKCDEDTHRPPTPASCTPPSQKNGLSSILAPDGFLGNLSIDDIILFGVLLLVLKDSADDPLLIIILSVVFISGFLDN